METRGGGFSRKRFVAKRGIVVLCLILVLGIFLLRPTEAATLAERRIPVQYFMTNTQGWSATMWEMVSMTMDSWEKELGLKFDREVLDHSELNRKGLFGGKFDLRQQLFDGVPERLDPGFWLSTRFYATCEHYYPRIPKEECPGGGGSFNSMGYYNPEFNKLMDMEKVTGIVEKDAFVNELETKHKIPRGEIERMIGQLLREGTIYEPREGCLKKT